MVKRRLDGRNAETHKVHEFRLFYGSTDLLHGLLLLWAVSKCTCTVSITSIGVLLVQHLLRMMTVAR